MASNIVAKLLLDDKDYSSKLDKARKNSKSFSSEISAGMTKAVGGLTAALGLAGGAFATMNKAIQSSQKTTDAFDKAMRVANTTVNSFFTSLTTGDLSAFNQGLGNLVSQAKAAAEALDQLGNTRISYNYFNSANQAEFSEAMNTLRDNSAGAGDKAKAKATAEAILGKQNDITAALRKNVEASVLALAAEGNGLDYSVDDIRTMLGIDVGLGPSRAVMQSRYKDYLNRSADIRLNPQMKEVNGILKGTSKWVVDEDAQASSITALNEEYKDAILYNKLLNQMGDEQLQQLVSLMVEAENADRAYQSMSRSLIKINNQMAGGSGPATYGVASAASVDYTSGMAGVDWGKFVKDNKSALNEQFAPMIKAKVPNAQPYVNDLNGLADAGINAQESLMGLSSVMLSLSQIMSGEGDSWAAWASVILEMIGAFSGLGFAGVAGSAMTGGMVNFKVVGTSLVGVLENIGKHSSYKA